MLIDLHNHTRLRSPSCSRLDPDELVTLAKGRGVHGICITEHDDTWPKEELAALSARHNFLVLGGMEVNTEQGHFLVFGVPRYEYGMHRLEYLREVVEKHRGVLIAAHPFRNTVYKGGVHRAYSPDLTVEAGAQRPAFRLCDALETLNGNRPDAENAFARKVAEALGKPQVGGSDAHLPAEVGRFATEFDDPIRSVADLVEAIRAGRCRPVDLRVAPYRLCPGGGMSGQKNGPGI